ncbi:tetratricopeptide repeat protein [Streptomyces swartbergensis]|uniref:MalT-like TPR region domain-containing protein n=1 Tax=Streptomyces swartbergensis TaxID=487165 RepID=A0A243RJV0_9ACTN|nr:tetratricopeptide repeat protein [Streptomyces swartbergensis]OUC95147.1 hypothetical protein CA983_33935 [Streptomyces swartbergensis]
MTSSYGTTLNEALALVNLATDFYQLGEHQTAEPLFAQAVSIFRDIGDRHGEGQALNNLGLNLGMLHRRQEGVDALTRATAIYSELGDQRLEQTTRHNLQRETRLSGLPRALNRKTPTCESNLVHKIRTRSGPTSPFIGNFIRFRRSGADGAAHHQQTKNILCSYSPLKLGFF